MLRTLFDLTGRVALVTGGNGGIGLGMARGLAAAGATIAVAGRDRAKNDAAVDRIASEFGGLAVGFVADLAASAACEGLAHEVDARFGRIDILINNAGINIRKPPHEMSIDEWQRVVDVNLTSVFAVSKAVQPRMKRLGGGKIINIGSMTSIFGASFAPAYAATKGAVVQLTKSLALAWAADNIQVNAILPGWFETDLTREARRQIDGLHEKVLARIPHGRWGEPDDMAGTAIWLASGASDYVTGAAIVVDGGYSSQL
jgi:2-deoxy-D-gluconate 3-dehydrogenase